MYSVSLSRTVVAINKLLFAGYFSKNVMESLSNDELDVLMEGYIDDGLFMDIYDFKLRNDCIAEYDLENQLCNIKAKTLVLGISGYLFFSPEVDALPLDDLIKDSEVHVLDSKTRNYYEKEDFSQLADKIFPFLDQFR
jgi:homoserine O-acetyltransferase